MPQPLSRVRSKADFFIAGADSLAARPELALEAMKIIGVSSFIGYQESFILTHLLKADPIPGMAMYEALSGAEARRSALDAAAKSVLRKDDYAVFRAAMNAISPSRSIRNRHAHHLWGHTPALQDALLLIDPQCMSKFTLDVWKVNQQMAKERRILMPPEKDRSLIAVYRRNDFIAELKTLSKAVEILEFLGSELEMGFNKISPGAKASLLSKTGVRSAYAKIVKNGG